MNRPLDGRTYARICQHCGKEFRDFYAPSYCSEVCRKKLAAARARRNHHLRKQNDPDHKAKISKYARNLRERDLEAYRKRQREWIVKWRAENPEAAKILDKKNQLRYADGIRAKEARRRARRHHAFVEDIDMSILYDRDRGVCGICMQPVDRTLPWPDPGSKTIDHIMPLSKGGLHSYLNVQLAHAVCNIRKGAKTVTMPNKQLDPGAMPGNGTTERLGDNNI